MIYGESAQYQITAFIRFVGFGVIIGIWYILLSALRRLLGEKSWMFILFDLIFCTTSAVFSFLCMILFYSGQVRYNLMLAELIGAILFYHSLGKYLLELLSQNIKVIRKVLKILFSPLTAAFRKLSGMVQKIKSKIPVRKKLTPKAEKKSKKLYNILKYLLKNSNESV